MRIAILGAAGHAGSALAQHLAPLLDAHAELLLVGRRPAQLNALCEQINRQAERTLAHVALGDLHDSRRMRQLLADSQLVIVTAALGDHTATLAATVLDIGADWFDIMLSSTRKWQALAALAPQMERQGRCFITDGGFHPGLPAAMVRWAARHMDSLHQAEIYAALHIDWQAATLSDSTLHDALEEFTAFDMRVWTQGAYRRLTFRDLPSVTFPAPIGRRTCTPMPLGEMQALIQSMPSLERANFYIAGFTPFCDWVLLPIIMLLARVRARTLASAALRRMLARYASVSPPHRVDIMLTATGRTSGQDTRLALSLSGDDPYLMTVLPPIATLRQWLHGPGFPPGLHYQGMVVDPERFFTDLHAAGLSLSWHCTPICD